MKENHTTGSLWRTRCGRVLIFVVVALVCCMVRAFPYLQAREAFRTETFTVQPKPDGDVRTRFLSESFFLQKGVYTILLDTAVPVETEVVAGTAERLKTEDGADGPGGIQCLPLRITGGTAHREFRVHVTRDTEAALLVREYYEGNGVPAAQLQVSVIYRPTLGAVCYALDTLLCLAALAFLVAALRHLLVNRGRTDAWIPLLLYALIVFLSFPLFRDYVTYGHDTIFHVRRIASLAEELFAGRIPVRLAQTWKNGYGYPVSIFYGDVFLVPAAVLFRLGVPLFRCYQLHILWMNTAAVLLSYHCFLRMAHRPWTAFTGSVLYAGSERYAANLFLRGAIGEGMGMAALPLVAAGFYELMHDAGAADEEKAFSAGIGIPWRPVLYLTLGFTALIQVHTLTTVQAAVFAFLFCLLHIRRMLQKNRLRTLLFSAGLTALVNLWFLVPFADYYRRHGFYAKLSMPVADTAVPFARILSPEERFQGIGIAMLGLLVLCIIGTVVFARVRKASAGSLMLLSALAVVMGTDLFPWEWTEAHLPAVYGILGGRIQYVWRYFSIATLLICVTAMVAAGKEKADKRRVTGIALAVLAAAGLFCSAQVMNESLHPEAGRPVLRAADVWNGDGGDALYMFDDLLWYDVPQETILADEGLFFANVSREGTAFTADVENASDEELQIAFPVWNYYGYAAEGFSGGTQRVKLSVTDGAEHRVSVRIPAGFSGTVTARFREPWYWRVAELVSVIAILLTVVYHTVMNRKGRNTKT